MCVCAFFLIFYLYCIGFYFAMHCIFNAILWLFLDFMVAPGAREEETYVKFIVCDDLLFIYSPDYYFFSDD